MYNYRRRCSDNPHLFLWESRTERLEQSTSVWWEASGPRQVWRGCWDPPRTCGRWEWRPWVSPGWSPTLSLSAPDTPRLWCWSWPRSATPQSTLTRGYVGGTAETRKSTRFDLLYSHINNNQLYTSHYWLAQPLKEILPHLILKKDAPEWALVLIWWDFQYPMSK